MSNPTPLEVAINLTKKGNGASEAEREIRGATQAATALGQAALKAEQEQTQWNDTLAKLSPEGLKRVEEQLKIVITETDKAGQSTDALKKKLDEVQNAQASPDGGLRGAAADARALTQATPAAAQGTLNLASAMKTLAPLAAAMKLKSLATDALAYGESIKDASERTGLAYEEVQRLTYAADQQSTSFADLESGLKNLAINLVNNEDKLKSLGIVTRNADGSTRDLREALGDVSDVIMKTEDPAKRTALAVDLLGRSGQQLVPLLAGGSAALKQFGDQAQASGRILAEQTVADLDEAKQRLDDFSTLVTINAGRATNAFMGFGKGMGQFIGYLATMDDGLGDLSSSTAANTKVTDLRAEAQARVNAEWQVGIDKLRLMQVEYAKNNGVEAEDAKRNALLERANKKIEEEKESQMSPEDKRDRDKTVRRAQYDQDSDLVSRTSDPSTREKTQALLDRELRIDNEGIDKKYQPDIDKRDKTLRTNQNAAETEADRAASEERNRAYEEQNQEASIRAGGDLRRGARNMVSAPGGEGNRELLAKVNQAGADLEDGATAEELKAAQQALEKLISASKDSPLLPFMRTMVERLKALADTQAELSRTIAELQSQSSNSRT